MGDDQSVCGCCAGVEVQTPMPISNRPGLPAIAYRVGTYGQFKQSMLARLSDPNLPGLQALRTRSDADFSIALLDAWAMVADVLTFYQERIANESYKRTATERASLLSLARLVKYELQPGVAANTYLAFTLENAKGSPDQTTIGIGTQAQSLPNPGEKPQTYETVEAIEARTRWNALLPILTEPPDPTQFLQQNPIRLQGTNNNLQPGDMLLIIPEQTSTPGPDAVRRVTGVEIRKVEQQTWVSHEGLTPAALRVAAASPAAKEQVDVDQVPTRPLSPAGRDESGPYLARDLSDLFNKPQRLNNAVVQQIISRPRSLSDLEALALTHGWSAEDLRKNLAASLGVAKGPHEASPLRAAQGVAPTAGGSTSIGPGIYALRMHASLFGYNAPDWRSIPSAIAGNYASSNNDWALQTQKDQVDLDHVYSQVTTGSWIVVVQPETGKEPTVSVAQVTQVTETAQPNYILSGKFTRLAVTGNIAQPGDFATLRRVTVYAQNELLTPADLPLAAPVTGRDIPLPDVYDGLRKGQKLIVEGVPTDSFTQEILLVELDDTLLLPPDPGRPLVTHLLLKDPGLTKAYKRETVTIYGNVALATQGESIQNEVIGSGDASQPFQRFKLRQSPLTYVQASTQTGKASTLSIFANGIQWKEVDTLYGRGPRERVFVTHIEDDYSVTVQFGDGITGARLPTGEDNVVANYRKGTGLQGIVQAGQISLLKNRPLGVKGVTNPTAPTGADDPETLEDARRNADNTVRTLGRIVSASDYEDYARSYAAIAKANATVIWNNQVRSVFVTVAGPATPDNPTGTVIEEDSPLYNRISSDMRQASDPSISFLLRSYKPVLFRLSAQVRVAPDADPEGVLKQVGQTLSTTFSFDARDFGQAVTLAEVVACILAVQGVVTVNVATFYRLIDKPQSGADSLPAKLMPAKLTATLPHIQNDGTISLAELLIIDPIQPVDALEVMP